MNIVAPLLVMFGPAVAVFAAYLAAIRFGRKTHQPRGHKVDTLDHGCTGC